MQIGQSRRLLALGLLCVTLGATGCTSSAKPKHSFTPTATFSDPRGSGSPRSTTPTVATTGPNVRPGEKPPTPPAAVNLNASAGSLGFATYWIEALDWGYATTDSTLARSLYAPSCTGCTTFLSNAIDTVRQHNQHFRGGRISVTATDLVPTDGHAGATAIVDVTVQQTALAVIDAAGGVVESSPQTDTDIYRTWLRWNGHGWTVVDWKRAIVK